MIFAKGIPVSPVSEAVKNVLVAEATENTTILTAVISDAPVAPVPAKPSAAFVTDAA